MHQIGTTLTQFILDEQRAHNDATGEFTSVLNDIALACKKIAWLFRVKTKICECF